VSDFESVDRTWMITLQAEMGPFIVQHYRSVHAGRSYVEMYSPASRVYLFHLVPVAAGVRWKLELTQNAGTASDFACTVQVHLPPVLGVLARLSFLGHLLGRHVDEEAAGFVHDIIRKHHQAEGEGDRRRAEGGRR
jgi:hypothetical protein